MWRPPSRTACFGYFLHIIVAICLYLCVCLRDQFVVCSKPSALCTHSMSDNRKLLYCVVAKDGKKVREKVRKIASKVEEEDFTHDLEMV